MTKKRSKKPNVKFEGQRLLKKDQYGNPVMKWLLLKNIC